MPNSEEMISTIQQQTPVSPEPTDDFDYVSRGLELDEMGGSETSPEDPLGLAVATEKAQTTKQAVKKWLDFSYDTSSEDEKKMAFDLLYGMSEDNTTKFLEDTDKSHQVQNALMFGGAKEIQEAAKSFFGKNKGRMDDFMVRHVPDYEDLDQPSDIINLVKQEEALRLKPYKDVAGHWTVGWGHKLSDEEIGRFKSGIDKSQAEHLFQNDWNMAKAKAQDVFNHAGHDWDSLDQNRRDMLTELSFNVGSGGLSRYKNFMEAVESDDYKEMAKYHRRFAKDAKTGSWTDLHRNKSFFDMFIKPNVDKEDLPEIEAHWDKKNRQLGIGRPLTKIREGQRTHTLGRGQTLSEVGRQYEMPVKTIMQSNPDVKRHKIKAGAVLIIPKKEESTPKEK